LCGDSGIVIDDANNCAFPCKCQDERRRERLFTNSKITPAFRSKAFDNFKAKGRPEAVVKMLMAARHYANSFSELGENNWLVLLGEPGCGKTHLIMVVANQLLSKGEAVLYFPYAEGLSELKDTFNKRGEASLEDRLRELRKVPFLVVDDLFKGREVVNGWPKEIMFDILNYRYLNLLPTAISSERKPTDLLRVDPAIGSRILERGKGHIAVADGDSYAINYRLVQ